LNLIGLLVNPLYFNELTGLTEVILFRKIRRIIYFLLFLYQFFLIVPYQPLSVLLSPILQLPNHASSIISCFGINVYQLKLSLLKLLSKHLKVFDISRCNFVTNYANQIFLILRHCLLRSIEGSRYNFILINDHIFVMHQTIRR